MEYLVNIAVKKAQQSKCRHRVSAIALDRAGKVLATAHNRHRLMTKGGGIHAEQMLFGIHGVKTILICRVNKNGKLLPIDPCKKCKKIAKKLNIKIKSVI